MEALSALARPPVKAVTSLRAWRHCEERYSDCWPDWAQSLGDRDPDGTNAMVRDNSPRMVFSEIGRILMAILFVTVLVGAALGAFAGN